MNKVYVGNQEEQYVRDRRHLHTNEEVISSQTIHQLKHLAFPSINSIQFCVDSAVGLPLSVTATRVTARLLAHDRSQVGAPSAPSYSSPESEPTCPRYDLIMGWRGDSLHPSLTIICRIDTLERPSMAAKCVGFAVLKLCVDITGDQPSPNSTDARVFLNAGQYRLPIVYGRVPVEGDFSEALMDQLPHVHDAYLNVRLFDPSVDTPASARPEDGWSLNRDSAKYVDEYSIAGCLIQAIDFATEPLKKLPIPDSFLSDIKKGAPIGEGEKNVVLRQLTEWMTQVFPPLRQKIPLIDPKFMLRYEDRVGSFCALDMLYNMPVRTDLLRAAKDGLDAMPGTGKKFDNHIKYYKTYFRYLPGVGSSGSSKKDSSKENIADLIIDDASLDLDLSSYEYNPVYNDDFSRTVGIELSPYACLLVVVTSVDILTSQRGGVLPGTSQTASPNISENRQNINLRTGTRGSESNDTGGVRKDFDERAFKLRGLVGAYFGNHEPDAVWWGIVPLLVESPFQKQPTRASKLKGTLPQSIPANRAMRKNNAVTGGLGDSDDAVMTFQEGSSVGRVSGLNLKVNQWTTGDEVQRARNSNAKSSEIEEKMFFVNAGTHQVPLFCGFPPEDLIKAPNPLGWLLSSLATGVKSNDELTGSTFSWLKFGLCQSSSAIIDPSDADYNARRGKPMLKLSPGASAMISIVDPRLRQFSNSSVTRDPTIQIREDLIHKVLKARFLKHNPQTKVKAVDDHKRGQAQKMFKFKIGKIDNRSYQQAIPNNIYSETLMQEISRNFIKSISE